MYCDDNRLWRDVLPNLLFQRRPESLDLKNYAFNQVIPSSSMPFSSQTIHFLRATIPDGGSLEDLFELLKVQARYLRNSGPFPTFEEFVTCFQTLDQRYTLFTIPKRSGGFREICAPEKELKIIQLSIASVLVSLYKPAEVVQGFVGGRSIVTNVQAHLNRKYVLNLDLKDFFPGIGFEQVVGVLSGLLDTASPDLIRLIATFCCYQGCLPQGASSSPVLSNLVCGVLDERLHAFAQNYGLHYSRYADDLTFSTDADFQPNWIGEISGIIEQEGFNVNPKKVRLQHQGLRQEVTGLTVNEKPNVSRDYIRLIRSMLHKWETLSYEEAQNTFLNSFEPRHAKYGRTPIRLVDVLEGRLNFLRMVRGDNDDIFGKYYQQFIQLRSRDRV
jgi:RNA-directed DNA polymerase